ncbi:hypothetical protein [Kiloniella litopenaei]|uniref:hypothetical protein n=1 Tax=Kiloniella litopenaei TaxID=1549748 RepID=UPI003BAA5C36
MSEATTKPKEFSLVETLYDRGVLGVKDSRDRRAERRRNDALWLMELYDFLYFPAPLAQPLDDYELYGLKMSEEEAELRALYHRYLRGLPAAVTQSLRFLCKDQQMPQKQTVPLSECLDQLSEFRKAEEKRGG